MGYKERLSSLLQQGLGRLLETAGQKFEDESKRQEAETIKFSSACYFMLIFPILENSSSFMSRFTLADSSEEAYFSLRFAQELYLRLTDPPQKQVDGEVFYRNRKLKGKLSSVCQHRLLEAAKARPVPNLDKKALLGHTAKSLSFLVIKDFSFMGSFVDYLTKQNANFYLPAFSKVLQQEQLPNICRRYENALATINARSAE